MISLVKLTFVEQNNLKEIRQVNETRLINGRMSKARKPAQQRQNFNVFYNNNFCTILKYTVKLTENECYISVTFLIPNFLIPLVIM